MKLVTAAEMRSLEERAAEQGTSPDALMEAAGLAVAQEVWVDLGAAPECKVAVLVGPGNNGGDGLVAARHLNELGARVAVILLAQRGTDDANLRRLVDSDVSVQPLGKNALRKAQGKGFGPLDEALAGADAVLDAVLGTGRARPLEGVTAAALDRVAETRARLPGLKLFALDLPTGVDCDTGAADPHALRADVTIALGCSKAGLHALPGAEYAGRVEVVDIGLPAGVFDALPVELLNARWVRDRLPARPAGAHKGTFGHVLVVAGSRAYVGAARLAALGALRAGAGIVTVACPESVQPLIAAGLTEATYLPLPDAGGVVAAEAARDVARAADGYNAVLIGPGLGQGPEQQAFVRQLLFSLPEDGPPLVVDADGLNSLAKLPRWWERVAARCVLTPHPGEQSRLSRRPTAALQADRLAAARESAHEWRQIVVLKGAYSVVAAPDGRAAVNPYANPALATAGTGDVLAGVITALLSQGAAPFEAACCAVYLHAATAEGLRPELGDAGMIAGDLLPELPRTLRELRAL